MEGFLPAKEVADFLRRVISGEITLSLAGLSWNDIHAGNVEFKGEGWRLTVFNDGDSLDYIDSATSPDERCGDFDLWLEELSEGKGYIRDPLIFLSCDEQDRLKKILSALPAT